MSQAPKTGRASDAHPPCLPLLGEFAIMRRNLIYVLCNGRAKQRPAWAGDKGPLPDPPGML